MKQSLKNTKEQILRCINAVKKNESICQIYIWKEQEELYQKALQLTEVKVKLNQKKIKLVLKVFSDEEMIVNLRIRALALSVLILAKKLESMTNFSQNSLLSGVAIMAAELMRDEPELVTLELKQLKAIGFSEEELLESIYQLKRGS